MNRLVYVLQDKFGAMYIGATSNMERRLHEHRTSKVFTTRTSYDCRSLKVTHTWCCPDFFLADKLERWLHTLDKTEVIDLILDCPLYGKFLYIESTKIELPKVLVSLPNQSHKMHYSIRV